jgi:hypothetical protein
MSGITDCNCLSDKELANSLSDKLKSMVYNRTLQISGRSEKMLLGELGSPVEELSAKILDTWRRL